MVEGFSLASAGRTRGRFACLDRGTCVLITQNADNGGVFVQRSVDFGATWTEETRIADQATAPSVTCMDVTGCVVVYGKSSAIKVRVSREGIDWTEEADVGVSVAAMADSEISCFQPKGCVLVFQENGPVNPQVFVIRSQGFGELWVPLKLNIAGSNAFSSQPSVSCVSQKCVVGFRGVGTDPFVSLRNSGDGGASWGSINKLKRLVDVAHSGPSVRCTSSSSCITTIVASESLGESILSYRSATAGQTWEAPVTVKSIPYSGNLTSGAFREPTLSCTGSACVVVHGRGAGAPAYASTMNSGLSWIDNGQLPMSITSADFDLYCAPTTSVCTISYGLQNDVFAGTMPAISYPTMSFSPTLSPTTAQPTTASPTLSPTTASPTIAPTTAKPTPSPTLGPTFRPTDSPTTKSPTASPSRSPTTASPTVSLVKPAPPQDMTIFYAGISSLLVVLLAVGICMHCSRKGRSKRVTAKSRTGSKLFLDGGAEYPPSLSIGSESRSVHDGGNRIESAASVETFLPLYVPFGASASSASSAPSALLTAAPPGLEL